MRMSGWRAVGFVGLSACMGLVVAMVLATGSRAAGGKKSAAELEKEKAMQSPYPNDLGPDKIDDLVLKYPKQHQEGYKLMIVKCARCHTSARPLNSRFVEPAADKAKREATVAEWRKSKPELFKEPAVWQIEPNIWERYVKRMKAKPGCELSGPEAKAIWEFLVYDSNERKLGKNAGAWKAHRQKLLKEFKAKFPKRYEELEKQTDL